MNLEDCGCEEESTEEETSVEADLIEAVIQELMLRYPDTFAVIPGAIFTDIGVEKWVGNAAYSQNAIVWFLDNSSKARIAWSVFAGRNNNQGNNPKLDDQTAPVYWKVMTLPEIISYLSEHKADAGF